MEFEAVTDAGIRNILRTKNPEPLGLKGFQQLFLACAAKVTIDNWNRPNYTFLLIMTEDQEPLYLDSFYVTEFIPGQALPVEHFDELMKIIISNDTLLSLEFLYQDEDEDDEFVYECFFFADEDTRAAIEQPEIRAALLKSIPTEAQLNSPLEKIMRSFAVAVLS